MKTVCFLTLTLAWGIAWGTGPGWAGHAGLPVHSRNFLQESLHHAGKNVDEAWEAFHRAALGGTLASPALQTEIERDLHTSRLLLADARKAARDHDKRTVSALTARIEEIAIHVKEKSRRPKP